MAGNVTVHEYINQAIDARGWPIPVGQGPAVATQTNLSDATSDPFAAFNTLTEFIMVKTDGIVSIRFGDAAGSTPTAVVKGTNGNLRLAADETIYFGVVPGQIMAIITDT